MVIISDSREERSSKRLSILIWGAAALLLLLPLLAMQFTDEVDWSLADFIIMAAMLGGACGAFELARRMNSNRAYQAGVAVALLGAFLLTWANLAVGIIGNESNPANLVYFGVLAIGFAGALIGRFQPRGMKRAMLAMALAQALVALVAFLAGLGHTWVITFIFMMIWLASAWLFGKK